METVFFPFTYLPGDAARFVRALLGPFVLYRPSALDVPKGLEALEKEGALRLETPLASLGKSPEDLSGMLSRMNQWGAAFPETDSQWLAAQGSRPPLYDDTLPSVLRDAIRSHNQQELKDAGQDQIVQAQVFLHLIEGMDARQWEIAASMTRVAAKQKAMTRAITGKADAAPLKQDQGPLAVPAEAADSLISRRLSAWGLLLAHAQNRPEVLATTSMAAAEHLAEKALEAVLVWKAPYPPEEGMNKATLERWQRPLEEILASLAQGRITAQDAAQSLDKALDNPAPGPLRELAIWLAPQKSASAAFGLQPELFEEKNFILVAMRFWP
ncbi:MAG: hypothetical protein QMD09_12495 [Desulfatibacillaceae bacterium]|nr:hypothetical protein [Desulfatibacillaceae bacterium]